MPPKILAVFAFVLCLTVRPAFGEPAYRETTEYYLVEGSTREEILQSIAERGFEEKDGTICAAHTDWKVSWDIHYFPKGAESCSIRDFLVSVSVDYHYPEWNAPKDAPEALKQSWQQYIAALRKHEQGHQDIALAAGREIEIAFSNLPAASNCGQLQNDTEAVGHGLIKKFRKREKAYDEKTEHGKTQGADF